MESEIELRLNELRGRAVSDVDRCELAGLCFLNRCDVSTLDSVITYRVETNKDAHAIHAAESIVWTARRIRAGEWREALRGWGQIHHYRARNGGFLPIGISDCVGTIQNILEAKIGGPR